MSLAIDVEAPPLKQWADGSIRVGNTRVTLETLLLAYKGGESPEKLADDFDVLTLAEVYAAVAFYLRHKDEVEDYLAERVELAAELRKKITSRQGPNPSKSELLARQKKAD